MHRILTVSFCGEGSKNANTYSVNWGQPGRHAEGGGGETRGNAAMGGRGERRRWCLTKIVVIRLEPANTGSVVRMARAFQASGLRPSAAGAGAG